MREVYLFHDEMLGRLLDLAGDDTTVLLVSDHGFHCDHLRPPTTSESPEAQAATWHRQYGVLAMRGPGIQRDERIYGATLLDITPTVLTLFGLPVGRDMDGRPLLQALENAPPSVRSIPSWDHRPGPDGRRPAELQRTTVESEAAVEQLIALGYLPAATAESNKAVQIAVAESKFNLAIVHSAHGRARQALTILAELHAVDPNNHRYSLALAKTHANLGQHSEALAMIEAVEAAGWRTADGELVAAASLFNEGRTDAALARLAECERRYPGNAVLYGLMGNVHLARSHWVEADAAFDRALALDDDDPHAHNGAARAALKLGEFEKSAEHALRAIGLIFFFPQAHFHLGMAFKGMGETERAIRSLKLAVTQAPKFEEAQQELENLREARAQAARGR
jgi:tetratricopeptide (TPR) repeat protein